MTEIETMPPLPTEPTQTEPKKRGRPKKNPNENQTNDREPNIFGSATSKANSPKVNKELEQIREMLSSLFVVLSTGISIVNTADGAIILEKFPATIEAILKILRTNDVLRAYFLKASDTSAFVEIAIALASMFIPIAINHGMLPYPLIYTAGLSDETIDKVYSNVNKPSNKENEMGNISSFPTR